MYSERRMKEGKKREKRRVEKLARRGENGLIRWVGGKGEKEVWRSGYKGDKGEKERKKKRKRKKRKEKKKFEEMV